MQNGDCGCCVYMWGPPCLILVSDVFILGCCLLVYILKPVVILCLYGGLVCPGSDTSTLGKSLYMNMGAVCIACIAQKCELW